MKYMKLLIVAAMALIGSQTVHAQDDKDNSTKKGHSLGINLNGISYKSSDDSEEEDVFELNYCTVDLGINSLMDKTNYNSASAQNFLKVDPSLKNSNLFDMNQGKSINVNIYPVLTKYRLVKTNNFKLYLVSGLGLQLYNFRFNKAISYTNTSSPAIIMDTVNFSKNKLAFDYLNVPLNLTFKTRLNEDRWLVYGAGLTGGYRLSSWTKQISNERGKQKDHDQFDFSDFNSCVTAELGIDGVFRLYATYQLTSLQKDALDQHPFCIGIRFSGI